MLSRLSAVIVLSLSLLAVAKPIADPYRGLTNAQRLSRGLPIAMPRNLRKLSNRGPSKAYEKRNKPSSTPTSTGWCTTGSAQCCESVESASNPVAKTLLGLLGIVLSDLDILVGITCSPINILGLGLGECWEKPVCCENNDFGGLISIGCSPISIEL